jgi:aspartate aminotransferase
MSTQHFKNWDNIPKSKPDKILGMKVLYSKDKNPKKVNLTIGAYKDKYGKSWILPSVAEASRRMALNPSNDYLRPIGDREFTELAVELAYGVENNLLAGTYTQKQMAQAQCLSGAGGLLLAFNVVKEFYAPLRETNTIWIPNPTWGNHKNMA